MKARIRDVYEPDGIHRKQVKEIQTYVDWEQRRFELVKAISQGLYANSAFVSTVGSSFIINIPEAAVQAADAVLEEYKKEDEK